jgi:hypothetical protein
MNSKGKLIGSLIGNKIGNIFLSSHKSGFQRSHIVLLASGKKRPSDEHTADHLVSSQTLNDSVDNLDWATKPEQRFNQGVHVRSKTFKTYTGKLLPLHPLYGKQIKLSSDGFIRIGNRNWGMGTENKGSGDFKIKLNGSYTLVHVLMVECILGRLLTDDETVDHIDGVHGSNLVRNLSPLFGYDNIAKSVIKLVTRIDSAGNAVVFGGCVLAAEATPGTSFKKISDCLVGIRNNHKGYQWKDASEEDIDLFFSKLNEVDTNKLEWPEFSSNTRYPNLLKSIALFKEWERALAKLSL